MRLKHFFGLMMLISAGGVSAQCPVLSVDDGLILATTDTFEKDNKQWRVEKSEFFGDFISIAHAVRQLNEIANPHTCTYTLGDFGIDFSLTEQNAAAEVVPVDEGPITVGQLQEGLQNGVLVIEDITYMVQGVNVENIFTHTFDEITLAHNANESSAAEGRIVYDITFTRSGSKGTIILQAPDMPVLEVPAPAPLPVPVPALVEVPAPTNEEAALKVRYDAVMAQNNGAIPGHAASVAGFSLNIVAAANNRADGNFIRAAWSAITNNDGQANRLAGMDAGDLIARIWAKVRVDRSGDKMTTFINKLANLGENGETRVFNRLVMLVQTLEEIA